MGKKWLQDGRESFCRSISRKIDRETLIDLLAIIEYDAQRSTALEDLGIEDKGNPTEMLYDYLLDALGVPPEGYVDEGQEFSREEFYEIYYQNYLLDKAWPSLAEVLDELEATAKDMAYQWNFNYSLERY